MPRFLASGLLLLIVTLSGLFALQNPAKKPGYVKKATRGATAAATLESFGLPSLNGDWHYAGPFTSAGDNNFETAFPPEKAVDLKAEYPGGQGNKITWKSLPKFNLGRVYNIAPLFPNTPNNAAVYFYHSFEAEQELDLPISLGSDDTLSVWFNGKNLINEFYSRAVGVDQNSAVLKVKKGKNELLVKVCQLAGDWAWYVAPELPKSLPKAVLNIYNREFPSNNTGATVNTEESKYYKITTLQQPEDCVLEVGGLGFRPDGKLLACTRRGEVWLIANPGSDNPDDVKFTRFATGLHEALGLSVESDNEVYVVQRPELTKLIDQNGDGTADEFQTICDKWGVSGDYHEFAFGPARDKEGNFFITLNVGFGGGHQSKAPWRGWCVKVTPKGDLEPWAYGIRSPNGVNFSPDGDLFYCDNQGEWVASNKMHHLKKGKFYGHQAGLRWVKESPFAGKVSDQVTSGMLYDGQPEPGKKAPKGMPELDPPCIWFPYGRMGQSVTEPQWDTTKGKFGPFDGQCFVGDQTKSIVMRVALEKVNGVYQGACFPFRSGFQSGVNRITFGPDGGMYCGQTARGWGSLGGKQYGLQRLNFTGEIPFETHHVSLTKDGFEFHFTEPVDVETAKKLDGYTLSSFTYVYFSRYGCPETDTRPEKITQVTVSEDRKSVRLSVPDLKPGRVYDFRLADIKNAEGENLLHPEAYYTLNELVK